MMDQHPFDLLAGYALGSLDEDDLLVVARHLPLCAVCRAEVNAFYEVADHLALSATPHTPPPALKDRILQQVLETPALAAETPALAAGTPAVAVPPPARPAQRREHEPARKSFFGSLLSARPMAAAAALMVVLLVALAAFLWQQISPAGDNMRIVRLQGAEDAPSVQGYLMVFENEPYGTLVVEHAPPLDYEYQYQLWLVKDGKRTSGGVFSVYNDGYGVLQVEADYPLNEYDSFGVTVEPEGGSYEPTGKRILSGEH